MGSDFQEEAPNVVTETFFRALMRDAFEAEVVCRKTAYKRAAVWYGEWVIRVVDQKHSTERLLVPARRTSGKTEEVAARTFKTANGLISFLESFGFTHVNIPLHRGGRSTHVLPDNPNEDISS
jgi:hypothetical protein